LPPCRRLLTDEDPALRTRLFQVLFQDGRFQWDRLENLLRLAKEGVGSADGMPPSSSAAASAAAGGSLDLSSTVSDGARVVLLDDQLRRQLLRAFTEDDRLHVEEVARLLRLVQVRLRWCAPGGGAMGVCWRTQHASLLLCCVRCTVMCNV
jgi:hypothetical protein